MAQFISPATLENTAFDAVMKIYWNVTKRIITAEDGSPELAVNQIFRITREKLRDLQSRLRVLSRRLLKYKKKSHEQSIRKRLRDFYLEIQEKMEEVTDTVLNEVSALQEKWKRKARNEHEHNYIPETCQRIHNVLKPAVDFIHDQECKTVELNCDDINNCAYERSVYLYERLCKNIHKILESAAKSISDIQSKFFMHLQQPSHEMLRQLHYIIKNRIPPSLGDKMTLQFIGYIQYLYCMQCNYGLYYETESGRNALTNLIRAVIHPSVRTLDLESCDKICYTICKEMSSYNNIVVLKLGTLEYHEHRYFDRFRFMEEDRHIDQFIVSGLQAMRSLQVFHYYNNCTNGVLEALAKNCRHLRCLNIKRSQGLSNKCITSFADLEYLEEINLIRTSISRSLLDIINRMDQNEVTVSEKEMTKSALLVKSLSCSITSSSQVSLIVSKLCNIKKLKVAIPEARSERFRGERNFSYIKDLQFLVSICFENCKFSDIEEIIVGKGKALLELKLKEVTDVDIKAISANCPALTCLSLKSCTLNSSSSFLNNVFLPALEYLCLNMNNHEEAFSVIMMCGCPKLRVVKIQCYRCTDLDTVLQRNSLEYLEDLEIQTSKLPLEHLRQLIYQCGKLTALTYINDDYRWELFEVMCEVRSKFRGLEMRIL